MATAMQLADYIDYAGLPFKKEGRYLRSVEHDSLVIDKRKNYFIWNSQGCSGNLTQFIAAYFGIDSKAVHARLKAFRQVYQPKTIPEKDAVKQPVSATHLISGQLLDQAGHQYLIRQRHLKPSLVRFLADQGLVTSDEHHNIVFNWFDSHQCLVGQDVQGTVINHQRFGKRGTYKRIVAGSKPHFGFNVRFSGQFEHLYVFESPLDLLSYWQMYRGELKNTQLLSLSGASSKLKTINEYVQDQLATNGIPPYIHLAPDNDGAGRELIQKFTQVRLGNQEQHSQSLVEWSIAKDWNEQLQRVTAKNPQLPPKYTLDLTVFMNLQLFNKIRSFDHE